MIKVFKIIPWLLVVLLVCISTGCKNKKDINPIVGTWELYRDEVIEKEIYYVFNEDKTGSYTLYGNTKELTYEIRDNKISIKYSSDTKDNELEYSISGNILTIKDNFGEDVLYKRK